MMKKTILLNLFLMACAFSLSAQKFLRPFEVISRKKTTYIHMEDGAEIQCTVRKMKYKKGLIKSLEIETEDGKREKIDLNKINYVYFPQSDIDSYIKIEEFITDATQWDDGVYDTERIKKGYALFEKIKVIVKKEEITMLMQLLNPSACARIKVYHDPYTAETGGLSLGGIQVAGGDDKSYYISKDGEIAYRFKKKHYKKAYKTLLGDCPAIDDVKTWSTFQKKIFQYNEECK